MTNIVWNRWDARQPLAIQALMELIFLACPVYVVLLILINKQAILTRVQHQQLGNFLLAASHESFDAPLLGINNLATTVDSWV